MAHSAARLATERAKKNLLLDALGVYLRTALARLKLEAIERRSRPRSARLLKAGEESRNRAVRTSAYDLDRLALEADGTGGL